MVPHTLDARGTGTSVLQEFEVSPASLWASPRPSQLGLVPPLKPTPCSSQGISGAGGVGKMGVVGRTHLGPETVSNPSDLCHVPVPVLLCTVGTHQCLALPWEIPASVRVQACSPHPAPPALSQKLPCSQGLTPPPTPRVRVLSGGAHKSPLGSGTPSHGRTGAHHSHWLCGSGCTQFVAPSAF